MAKTRTELLNERIKKSRTASYLGLREIKPYTLGERTYALDLQGFDKSQVVIPVRDLKALELILSFLDSSELPVGFKEFRNFGSAKTADGFVFDLQEFPYPQIFPGGKNNPKCRFPGRMECRVYQYQRPGVAVGYERDIPASEGFLTSSQGIGLLSYLAEQQKGEKEIREKQINPSRFSIGLNGQGSLSIRVHGYITPEDVSQAGTNFKGINKKIQRFCEDFAFSVKQN